MKDDLSNRKIPEIEIKDGEKAEKDIWSYCGDAPSSRLIGVTASGKHGTCTECWWPAPTKSLIDGICSACRGDLTTVTPMTDAPTKEEYL